MRGSGQAHAGSKQLSFLFTNIRRAVPKCEDLNFVIDSCDANIVILMETWRSSKVSNTEIFSCTKSFNVHRRDREQRCCGGVLIAVEDKFSSFAVHTACDLEILWVEIDMYFRKFILGVCYRPPSSTSTFVDELHDALNNIVVRFPTVPNILVGNFNYPHIVWTNVPPQLSIFSSECESFLRLCADFNLCQLVTQVTRIKPTTSSTLDLVLTTLP